MILLLILTIDDVDVTRHHLYDEPLQPTSTPYSFSLVSVIVNDSFIVATSISNLYLSPGLLSLQLEDRADRGWTAMVQPGIGNGIGPGGWIEMTTDV